MTFKDILAIIILISFAAYSTWKGMQTVASVAIAGFILIIYKSQILILRNIIVNLVKSTKQAKLGSFELQIGDKTIESSRFQNFSTLTQILLTTTSSEEIGVLAEIAKTDKFEPKEALKIKLRALRDKGLINHNNTSLENANEVWITETGRNLINEILNTTR
ncbi:hypothetical protein DYU11_12580 [Fibrisoma montanum]|uniref:Uncharacterized protein n=1 Tax=Fibrisoma montanum TaxID=2305895 RepID=A0A418MBQ8_9BACT|nr:hypothetical protein [Fibrisoma montanum]RIV23799.1 hypothetical protein DYU11_12580 [Fibrisoma montanum]